MDDPLNTALRGLGAVVLPQWLSAIATQLQEASPGFDNMPGQHRTKMMLQQLLYSDLNRCGGPNLPASVQVRPCQLISELRTPGQWRGHRRGWAWGCPAAAAARPPAAPPHLCLQSLHDTTLPDKMLLQVDEVMDISVPIRERYAGKDSASRCLKLLLTDGGCWARRVGGGRQAPACRLVGADVVQCGHTKLVNACI